MIMHSRPLTLPSPVTTPAAGAPPYSSYIPRAAQSPNSRNSEPSSSSSFNRSRTVSRPLARCASAAFAPPPSRISSSSARKAVIKTRNASRFAPNRAAFTSSFDPNAFSNVHSSRTRQTQNTPA